MESRWYWFGGIGMSAVVAKKENIVDASRENKHYGE